ncbi:M23 family metallopeptidase [Pseudodesulfovibrio piezophilus]|uniref:M23 family metallopeptidase n=1 Tax=Pseudodesulfovibrio piezophilus TaxID=879567 RepID=UPI001E33DC53|nr:M23 family metallopeptidase [Pseudodesulfovibrio piezophilus]
MKSVEISALQNGKTIPLIKKSYPGGVTQTEEILDLAKNELQEGEFLIQVKAQDASLYPFGKAGTSSNEKLFAYDATPPRIFIQTHTTNLNQGGSGLMVYTLSEVAEETGIHVGDRFFPAYLQPATGNEHLYYCLFTIPWDTPPSQFSPVISANDKAGNEVERSFNFHANARHFRKDKINLSDSFMERTVPEFQGLLPNTNGTALEQYLYINNTMRKQNRAKLVELSRQTSSTMLWHGTFKRLPNAANRARFADARDYMYKGKKVDAQTHLGLDLASLKHAPVPAANDGVVVYADFLGIYGNVVVLDHGLGLQTLYAHMSSLSVNQGDSIAKGDILGHTGTTGLAGGDHLHYGVIVGGTPVQPIEWWDGTWIKNNITSKIQ